MTRCRCVAAKQLERDFRRGIVGFSRRQGTAIYLNAPAGPPPPLCRFVPLFFVESTSTVVVDFSRKRERHGSCLQLITFFFLVVCVVCCLLELVGALPCLTLLDRSRSPSIRQERKKDLNAQFVRLDSLWIFVVRFRVPSLQFSPEEIDF